MQLQTLRRADFNAVVVWLRERFGWDIEAEGFFADLHQLHLVAHVVKHGDGKSREALLEKAPELFRDFIHIGAIDLRGADELRLEREHFVRFTGSVLQFIECFPGGVHAVGRIKGLLTTIPCGRPPSRRHSLRKRSMVRLSQLPKAHLRCSSSKSRQL